MYSIVKLSQIIDMYIVVRAPKPWLGFPEFFIWEPEGPQPDKLVVSPEYIRS